MAPFSTSTKSPVKSSPLLNFSFPRAFTVISPLSSDKQTVNLSLFALIICPLIAVTP
ncbi:MAG: hypothetical protein SOX77_05645 [Candidatus Borkfalkiaceae bacterium]|nr:hypothetical protein [Christensenellaceae bacterium]